MFHHDKGPISHVMHLSFEWPHEFLIFDMADGGHIEFEGQNEQIFN